MRKYDMNEMRQQKVHGCCMDAIIALKERERESHSPGHLRPFDHSFRKDSGIEVSREIEDEKCIPPHQ
jgi:hypothetical protein